MYNFVVRAMGINILREYVMTERPKSPSPTDPKMVRKGFKTIALAILIFDAIGVFVLTLASYLLGDAVIGSYVSESSQNTGRVGWFLSSLGSSCCVMVALDFILCIACVMCFFLWAFFSDRGKSNNTK